MSSGNVTPRPQGTVVTVVVDRLTANNVRELVTMFDTGRPIKDPHRLGDFLQWVYSDGTEAGDISGRDLRDVTVLWSCLTPDQRYSLAEQVKDFWAINHLRKCEQREAEQQATKTPALRVVVSNAKPKRAKSSARPALALVQNGGAA